MFMSKFWIWVSFIGIISNPHKKNMLGNMTTNLDSLQNSGKLTEHALI